MAPTTSAPASRGRPPAAEGAAGSPGGRRTRRRVAAVLAVLLLAAVVIASLAIGSRPVPPSDVWAALTGGEVSGPDRAAVVDLRLPRTVAGLVVGAALGVAGAVIQALTRNPLAEPGVLGVNSGAGFAVAISVAFLGVTEPSGYVWFALVGAFLTTCAVFVVGSLGVRSPRPEQLLLAGVAFSAVLAGMISAIRLSDPERFTALQAWEAGSLRDRGWDVIVPALPFLALGVLVALLLGGSLNALALGEDRAASLGASVAWTRGGAILVITLLAGGATAIAGPIAFVGLMIPHAARWLTGPDQRWIMTLSFLLAPILLLVSDIIGRVIMWPGEVPVGIVTAFLGGPALIWLVRRRMVSAL
ncbi:FecCD family ABC transporter permease [Nocardioides insulae]|uniref:FecCD family ABC transporter permease n=1 Tax=Nocardioides insulae TaxID=394734 RepID=UPI00041D7712|nr:iron chelate uptake ABC transporter family permease subunit [Nocardioides insulae]